MPTLDDVARLAVALPETEERDRRGARIWCVRDKVLAWERPFTKADIRRFGDVEPPRSPIVALRVADLGEKEAVLAGGSAGVFTIPHLDGFAAVLVELDAVEDAVLGELLTDAWLACAPNRLADAYLAARTP